MNLNQLSITCPCTHENLTIFLVVGADALDGTRDHGFEDAVLHKNLVGN